MDPIQLAILTSVAGGVTGGAAAGLIQSAVTAAVDWLRASYAGHPPAAQQHAAENSQDFLQEFVACLQRLEATNAATQERIASAMDRPSYSMLMQQAVLGSSRTDSHDTHVLLALLVSERLRVDEETIVAKVSPRACDVVAALTGGQLKLLGLLYTLQHMQLSPAIASATPDMRRTMNLLSVQHALAPYQDVECTQLDWMVLSDDCLITRPGMLTSQTLDIMLRNATSQEFDYDRFYATESGARIRSIFDNRLNGMHLTAVGSLIGLFVSDQLARRVTDITAWEG